MEIFQHLGDSVERAYKNAGYEHNAFASIANSALGEFNLPHEVTLSNLLNVQFAQPMDQDAHPFSDLSTRVFQTENFYIEILFWSNSTTTIHQHSFSGAFKVLEGSSLHTKYKFNERTRIDKHLQFGGVKAVSHEILKKGDIERIDAGENGLTHSLYHLDNPSITLVVRTNGREFTAPQMDLVPPAISIASQSLSKDKLVRNAIQSHMAIESVADESAAKRWVELLSKIGWPRIFQVCLELKSNLIESPVRTLLDANLFQKDEAGQLLANAIDQSNLLSNLSKGRSSISEPSLRFFLALLLNVHNREGIFQILESTHPNDDPSDILTRWIIGLGNPENVLSATTHVGQGWHHRKAPSLSLVHFARGVTICPKEHLQLTVATAVKMTSTEKFEHHLRSIEGISPNTISKCHHALAYFKSMPELRPLYNTSESNAALGQVVHGQS